MSYCVTIVSYLITWSIVNKYKSVIVKPCVVGLVPVCSSDKRELLQSRRSDFMNKDLPVCTE